MVKTEYLRNATGIRRFAVCASCGKASTNDLNMVRITITRDDVNNPCRITTAVLCQSCFRQLKNV